MNKAESKYYNTACLMDEALLRLLETKEYDYITVKEICEKAGVNRSTFYLHYQTMDELLEESLSYMLRKFDKQYDDRTKAKLQSDALENLFLITPEYIVPYLEFLKEHKSLFITAVKKPNIFKMNRYFDLMYDNVFGNILERFRVNEKERKYILAFFIGGMHTIIIEWIKRGCEESVSYIAELLIKYTPPYREAKDEGCPNEKK